MERNVSSLAIVLHSQRYGQLNRRLKLLSVDFGIIDVVSYGARKSLKSIKAEAFSDGQFFLYYNPVKKDYTLKDVQIIATHDELRSELDLTYSALLFCELILKTHGGESAKEYQLLSQALDFLVSDPDKMDRIIIQFIHQLSDLLGLRGDYERCPLCERPYGEREVLSFSTALNAPCCSDCGSLDASLLLLPGSRRYLSLTSSMSFAQSLEVPLSPTATARIKQYLLSYAQIITGGALKTLAGDILRGGEGA
ncbi:MAG: DNA repair protein RecO [Sphaerochaeta sp.]|jgi:DNA repair protein RecO (recombination protein O)|uniref:DNA repair protein RecO n=1 Tax=Sphaerochaeta sp. TaxID=1972642 RepID=UPI002FC65F46